MSNTSEVVLITGASRGLGRELARLLAQQSVVAQLQAWHQAWPPAASAARTLAASCGVLALSSARGRAASSRRAS